MVDFRNALKKGLENVKTGIKIQADRAAAEHKRQLEVKRKENEAYHAESMRQAVIIGKEKARRETKDRLSGKKKPNFADNFLEGIKKI